jgi:hypothetical protein
VVEHFRRIAVFPDFLMDAADLSTSPSDNVIGAGGVARSLTFNSAVVGTVYQNLAGPGTIDTPQFFTFDKTGPAYFNSFGDVMDGTPYFNQTPGGDIADLYFATYFVWASYDGSTNAPIVFPNGTSVENLQNQVLIQVSPATLPLGIGDGQSPYTPITFTATGGSFTQPYTWSTTGLQGGTGLPAGMMLSPDGTLSGTPTQSGTFDFNLKLTDYVGRAVQWVYTITIQ